MLLGASFSVPYVESDDIFYLSTGNGPPASFFLAKLETNGC
jgi:hypothetical protein